MNRKRILLLSLFILLSEVMILAQDVIVLNDGSTIISKVLEVNPDNIRYKKASNEHGPIYTIPITNVVSINYANGLRDTFSKPQPANPQVFQQQDNPSDITNNKEDIYLNDALISSYNDRVANFEIKSKGKKSKWMYRILKVHPSSNIANTDGRLSINLNRNSVGDVTLHISLENNTDEMIYVDLDNCTFRVNKKASSYYVNSSTTTTHGSSGGASVNIGSIASAIGIGGVIGNLASGVNVGGGNSSSTSTTVYANRIVTIPPRSKYNLPVKVFYDFLEEKPYRNDFTVGERHTYNQPSYQETPWEVVVSYVKESNINDMKKFYFGLYISEEVAIKGPKVDKISYDSNLVPLYYLYGVW